jgi:hypothetical protein
MPPLDGGRIVFAPQAPEQRRQSNRRSLRQAGAFGQVERIHQAIELFDEPFHRAFAAIKPGLLWHGVQTGTQQ